MLKVGDKIRIIQMKHEPRYSGKEGIIKHIDGIGQCHGTWGELALIPELDEFQILPKDNEVNPCPETKISPKN